MEACVHALKAHPKLNAHFRDDAVVFYDDVNLGLAVANDKGLIVPVIHGAQKLSLGEIGARRRELAEPLCDCGPFTARADEKLTNRPVGQDQRAPAERPPLAVHPRNVRVLPPSRDFH